jgi:F-type H+-transporting ATPase subunit epsilon
MHLTILTPVKQLFQGDIKTIKVPGVSGQFEVLKGHANIVSALGKGIVQITDESGKKTDFKIKQGFIEVLKDEVSVLVTRAEQ